jgi:hypothetical protein
MASRFERLAATLEYPPYVVTTAFAEQPAGCLVVVAVRAPTLAVHVIEEKDKGIANLGFLLEPIDTEHATSEQPTFPARTGYRARP